MHRAIETRYAGCLFRSRTEARWAVFFDALGIKWDYEPEGYELPSGRYLPDFFLKLPPPSRHYPGAGYWVEIKGVEPTPLERQLLQELCTGTGHHGYLFYGRPCENVPIRFNIVDPADLCDQRSEEEIEAVALLTRNIPAWRFEPLEQTFWAACLRYCAPIKDFTRKRLVEAAEVARSARFEFKGRA